MTVHEEALRRLSLLPGVIAVSSTAMLPLSGGYLGDGFVWPEGDTRHSDARRPMVFFASNVGVLSATTAGKLLCKNQ